MDKHELRQARDGKADAQEKLIYPSLVDSETPPS